MDVRRVNLDDLVELYFRRTKAHAAAELLEAIRNGRIGRDLSHLLRHHEPHGVRDPEERHLRDGFDSLLGFYSLLEIALLISFIPETTEDALWTDARKNLATPAVRTFYEQHYPLLLPVLLRCRLDGELALPSERDASAASVFIEFLGMENRLEKDHDIVLFLRFVDYFVIDGISLGHLMTALDNKAMYFEHVLKPPNERDLVGQGLHGFHKFLQFCGNLDSLLRRSEAFPLFRSAMWHYHAYWFQTLGKRVGVQLKGAVQRFLSWTPDQDSEEHRAEVRHYVSHAIGVIDRLTSGAYGKALEQAAYQRKETLPLMVDGARLVLRLEDRVVKEVTIGASPITIGRDNDNVICIENLEVAAHHAKIYSDANRIVIEDLDSLNGTFVNNRRITRSLLRPGDKIIIGKHHIVLDR